MTGFMGEHGSGREDINNPCFQICSSAGGSSLSFQCGMRQGIVEENKIITIFFHLVSHFIVFFSFPP